MTTPQKTSPHNKKSRDPLNTDPLRLADWPRLKRFVVVAKVLNLTKAAALLGTTQSVLSLQMAALERDCAGRLFHRTGRGLALSELGERFLPRAQALLQGAQLLAEETQGAAGVPIGEVTLGLLPSLASTLAAPLLAHVLQEFPSVQLRILEGSNGQLDEWMAVGRLDAALLYRYGKTKVQGEEVIATIDSWLVAAAGDVLTQNGKVSFAKLHALPLILPSMPNGLRAALHQQALRARIKLKVIVEVDSIPTQIDLVRQGFGYGIMGAHAIAQELKKGQLQAAKIERPSLARVVTLAISHHHPQTLAGKAVTKVLRDLSLAGIAAGNPR